MELNTYFPLMDIHKAIDAVEASNTNKGKVFLTI